MSPRRNLKQISKRERNFWALVVLSLILAVVTWQHGSQRSDSLIADPANPDVVISAQPTPEYDCAINNPFNDVAITTWTTKHTPGSYNATAIDLVNNCTYSLGNPDGRYPMASTGKVMIATGVLEMVANGILDYSSIQSDLTAMITQSDNSAADRLYAIMGKAAPMQDLEVRYGLTQTTTDRGWGTTLTSSADQAKLLNQVIGKQESPLPEAQREVLGTLMKSVVPEQAWGAGTNIPAGWSAAVKNGWYQSVPGDIPPVGLWRINTVGLVSDAVNTPRWILTAYSNEWPSQSAGISAWNDLSALLSGALGK